MVGKLDEAYLTELQQRQRPEGQQSLFEDYKHSATAIAVVTAPTGGIVEICDEFMPELGMPRSVLDDFQKLRSQMNEVSGVKEHNKAYERCDLDSEYRTYLKLNSDAQEAVESVVNRLESGESITLVCFEKSPKRCHRHVLKEEIEKRLGERSQATKS